MRRAELPGMQDGFAFYALSALLFYGGPGG
jgi:hypothetical protein